MANWSKRHKLNTQFKMQLWAAFFSLKSGQQLLTQVLLFTNSIKYKNKISIGGDITILLERFH